MRLMVFACAHTSFKIPHQVRNSERELCGVRKGGESTGVRYLDDKACLTAPAVAIHK
jgi:hypothetical protein